MWRQQKIQALRVRWIVPFMLLVGGLSGCSLAPLKQRLAPDGMALDRYPQIQRAVAYRCGADGLLGTSDSDCRPLQAMPSGSGAAVEQLIDHDLHSRFLQARSLAMSKAGDPMASSRAYFKVGKTLVQTLCSRWFDSMELEQRRLDGVDKSFNVWKAFGTTLLGLGNANSTIVSLYGGATTLDSGLSTAYKDVYLLGGSIAKVKLKMFGLIDDYATEVQTGISDYEGAYVALERMGILCSPSTAKLIIDTGVDSVDLRVNASLKIERSNSPAAVALAEMNAVAQQKESLEESAKALTARLANLRALQPVTQIRLKELSDKVEAQQKEVVQMEGQPPVEPTATDQQRLDKARALLIELQQDRNATQLDLNAQAKEINRLEEAEKTNESAIAQAKKAYQDALAKLRTLN